MIHVYVYIHSPLLSELNSPLQPPKISESLHLIDVPTNTPLFLGHKQLYFQKNEASSYQSSFDLIPPTSTPLDMMVSPVRMHNFSHDIDCTNTPYFCQTFCVYPSTFFTLIASDSYRFNSPVFKITIFPV